MGALFAPHGGHGLINRYMGDRDSEKAQREAAGYKDYLISDGDLSVFFRIADGTLSPLEGPMGRDEFCRVLEEEVIGRGSKKYAWSIPVAFPVSGKEAERIDIGETLAVRNARGVLIGLLKVGDKYYFDKNRYNSVVYGTEREDHPGARIVNDDPRDHMLGGKISAIGQVKHPSYGKYILSPVESRRMFEDLGWERIIAFQTRNPLHRAHEYAIVYALEKLVKEGFNAGAVLNPLVGETKSDDVPAAVRMKTYEALIDAKLLGAGDRDEALWRSKGVDFMDRVRLIALDIKMYYAGPKEAVMNAIYRQNCGFTDIIIGRKHADAPFDDGMPVWGDFDAQEKFSCLKGELLIRPLKVGTAAYVEELGRVAIEDEYKHRGYNGITISGKELRNRLEKGEPIDERVMRKPVADILYDAYRHNIGSLRTSIKSADITWHYSKVSKESREKRSGNMGVVVWLTGLSCSGKSTIAVGLENKLFNMGHNAFVLDGDNIRHGLNRDLGFSPEDREENIRRIGEVAKLFAEAGFVAITAFVSPYKNDRDNVRSLFPKGEFMEVYVKASLEVCERRDVKGLYKKARLGEVKEFTGISAPYEEPDSPEIIIDTENHGEDECITMIVELLRKKGYLAKR